MKLKSRTQYSAVNTAVAISARLFGIFLGFVTRVVFTRMLNESYVGINGLFTDILNILSLSELGVGTAITYALYRPIAEGNIVKQQALMQMFKKFYHITALAVGLFGLALIPFMDIIMKNRPDVEHLMLIYLMYLSNTILSYLLIYKRTLIEAHQMNYIVLIYQTFFYALQDICQIIVLILTRNFILFLSVHVACTVLSNIFISRRADKLFPYLLDKTKHILSKDERQDIYKNIRAMVMHKLGNVIVNNTDNLIISSFVGVISVGVYSNYFLVIGSVKQVFDQVFQGITASVGNLGATEDEGHVKSIFETAFFIGQWMYGFAAICLYELLNSFMELSFGKNYLFTKDIVLVLCINFFLNGTRMAVLTFRDSLGLFWYDRYKAVAEALLNLVVSIILVKNFNVFGVFAGTFISTLLTSVWVEPFVLYKYRLGVSSKRFFFKYFVYCVITGIVWFITDVVCTKIKGSILFELIIHGLVCAVLPNLIFLLVYFRTRQFKAVLEKAKGIKKAGD